MIQILSKNLELIADLARKKMNTAQFIPRASRELQNSPELYHKLQENFEDMFEWQQTKAK